MIHARKKAAQPMAIMAVTVEVARGCSAPESSRSFRSSRRFRDVWIVNLSSNLGCLISMDVLKIRIKKMFCLPKVENDHDDAIS